MKAEDLFLETMEDLRRRADLRASEYDMVQVAGLLRRLLLDAERVTDAVNRQYRYQPVCRWSAVDTATPRGVYLPRLWLDPLLWEVYLEVAMPAEARQELKTLGVLQAQEGSLQQFLAYKVVREAPPATPGGDVAQVKSPPTATVRDLIRHFAHREGGVHYGSGETEHPLLQRVRHSDDMPLRLTLLAAGRIVHRALEPLAVRVALHSLDGHYGVGGR